MPAAWSKKDERQYKHIVDSCKGSAKKCKRMAAATVNKRRRREGRTLDGLVDAEEQHREHPKTFQIPPRQARENAAGKIVKVIWRDKDCGERPWVIVQEQKSSGRYKGVVDNDTSCGPLRAGSKLEFGPENIVAITEFPSRIAALKYPLGALAVFLILKKLSDEGPVQ
jgi:hypothetical protein